MFVSFTKIKFLHKSSFASASKDEKLERASAAISNATCNKLRPK